MVISNYLYIQEKSKQHTDIVEKLERLGNLKQKGIITDEEFQKIKSGYPEMFSKEVLARNKGEQLQTHGKTSDALNDFLTYENVTYGIRIQYPSNWEGTEVLESYTRDTIHSGLARLLTSLQ